ncbi:MAG TPA: hypothetical protein VMU25_04870 [Candidatus Paceibacterota bacterium]|nr:hypothetical protein [Candidatus Paceibacterota bacterium]
MSFPRYLAALFAALVGTYLVGMIAGLYAYDWGFWPLFAAACIWTVVAVLMTAMTTEVVLALVFAFGGGVFCTAFLYDVTPGHYNFFAADPSSRIPLLFAGCFWFFNAVIIVVSIHVLWAKVHGNTRELEAYRVSSETVRAQSGRSTLVIIGLLIAGIAIAIIDKQMLEHDVIALNTFLGLFALALMVWVSAAIVYVLQLLRRPHNSTS